MNTPAHDPAQQARSCGPSLALQLVAVVVLPALLAAGALAAVLTGQAIWLVVLALAAYALSAALAAWWAIWHVCVPVRRLARAMDRLGEGDTSPVRLHGAHEVRRLHGAHEVRRLQGGFNRAAAALADGRHTLESRVQAATTELARQNAQIDQTSQAKTRLLAAASHDLRQPLHALTLLAEGLSAGETDPVRLQRFTQLRACVESLDHLFTELLNISQIDAGVLQPQPCPFALDRLFDEVSRNFRPIAEAQALRLVVRQTRAWVHTDYVMLSRILGNLVANALRYTAQGGVLLAARRRGGQVQIDVLDTGVGIAFEHQQQVFDEFFRLDHNPAQAATGRGFCLGLGLATVKRLTHLLDVPLELRSIPGRGTGFRLLLPGSPAPAPAPTPVTPGLASLAPGAAASAALAPQALAGTRVLVIDDEPVILLGLQMVLDSWGATVVLASDGQTALQQAREADAPFDIVLCDLLLRGGENGLAVLRALGAQAQGVNTRTAMLLVTGETKPERLREVSASCLTVLYKPVTPATLRAALLASLQARPAVPSGAGHASPRGLSQTH